MKKFLFLMGILFSAISHSKDVNWELSSTTDELTGKKDSFLYFRKEGFISGQPKSLIEIKSYCSVEDAIYKRLFSADEISLYNASDLFTESVQIIGNIYENRSTLRMVRRDGEVGAQIITQSEKFSNVYIKKTLLKTTRPGESAWDLNRVPAKMEFKFKNGSTYILNFNDSYFQYQKDCLSNN